MNLELKDAGTARKIAIVSFDAEEIKTKENEACKEIGKIANIPGFRKVKHLQMLSVKDIPES